jgi:hypothetical protein
MQATASGIAPQATEVRRLEIPPTPTPVPLPSEDDPRAILDLAHPDHYDYFDVPDTWYDYDNPGVAAYRQEHGHLLGIDYEPEELYTWWSFTDPSSGNVYAEVTATNGDCIARDSVGLVIRVDTETASEGYALDVSCDGAWRLRLHRRNQAPRELLPFTESEAVNSGAGASNRLGIYAYAGRIVLFLNGEQVGEVVDRNYTLSYGQFALYVRASQTFDLTATFDDFAFWHLPFIP